MAVLILPIAGIFLIFGDFEFPENQAVKNSKPKSKTWQKFRKYRIPKKLRFLGEITNVESEILPSGMNVGRAVIRAQLPSGEFRNFKSEQIEGLTAGLLVSYLARPSKIPVLV